jgi:hypothetical protein
MFARIGKPVHTRTPLRKKRKEIMSELRQTEIHRRTTDGFLNVTWLRINPLTLLSQIGAIPALAA